MMADVILDSDSLCSLNHCKIAVMYVFFPNFQQDSAEIPNFMAMNHVPKILEKNPMLT